MLMDEDAEHKLKYGEYYDFDSAACAYDSEVRIIEL